jgi:hypothetical protein
MLNQVLLGRAVSHRARRTPEEMRVQEWCCAPASAPSAPAAAILLLVLMLMWLL